MAWKRPKLKHLKVTKWGWRVSYPEYLELGDCVDIGAGTYIQAKHGMQICDSVQIGANCSIYTESSIDGKRGAVVIGPYACIGANSVVMPGIEIGPYAKVAALSFVNRSIPHGEVWGGSPAKRLRGHVEEGTEEESKIEGFSPPSEP